MTAIFSYAIESAGADSSRRALAEGTREHSGPVAELARCVLREFLGSTAVAGPVRVSVWEGAQQGSAATAALTAAAADVADDDLRAAADAFRTADAGLTAAMQRAARGGVSQGVIVNLVRGLMTGRDVVHVLGLPELRTEAADMLDRTGFVVGEDLRLWLDRGHLYVMFAGASGTESDLQAAAVLLQALQNGGISVFEPEDSASADMVTRLAVGQVAELRRGTPPRRRSSAARSHVGSRNRPAGRSAP